MTRGVCLAVGLSVGVSEEPCQHYRPTGRQKVNLKPQHDDGIQTFFHLFSTFLLFLLHRKPFGVPVSGGRGSDGSAVRR